MELNQFISTLWQSRTQAHVWHHQTDSYSEHKALNNYYDEIVEHVDGFVESVQGIYPIVTAYSTSPLVDWKQGGSTIYFKGLYDFVQKGRTTLPQETWIQNQIDNISELIAETIYLLHLK